MDLSNVAARRMLESGDMLELGHSQCIINTVIGEGTSSIAYEAMLDGRRVVLKELYPRGLGISRDTESRLIIPDEQKKIFGYYKARLKRAFDIQLKFHNDMKTVNYTTEPQELIMHNNTLYVVMHLSEGTSYDKVCPENILSILEAVRALCCAISFYHNKNFLHLDIKPQNFFIFSQTNQIVQLFDFDSIMPKNEIHTEELSYSERYAAPEVIAAKEYYGSCEDIDERADIFSIGAVMFEKIMGRSIEEDDLRNKKTWDFEKNFYLKNTVHQLQTGITEVFQKTLTENKEKRYKSAELLTEKLDELIKLTYIPVYLQYHNISVSTSKSYYISRSAQIQQIHESLREKNIVYLSAIGGAGKSETAKEYAETYLQSYTNEYFSNYSSSLKQTISDLFFNGLDDREKEEWYFDTDKRYEHKLNLLRSERYSENTLIIIDNFDINTGGYANNTEVLKELKLLKVRFIFTTRGYKEGDPQYIKIKDFSVDELKKMFFSINPQDRKQESRQKQVEEIIKKSYCHIMTVDLIAHLSRNVPSLHEYISLLDSDGIANAENISEYMKIESNKDENAKSAAVYTHIRNLFNFSVFTKASKYIMINACFLPLSGMEQKKFIQCIRLSRILSNSHGISSAFFNEREMDQLIKAGWLKYSLPKQKKLVIHPLVAEVIIKELQPALTEEKCRNFFVSFLDMICEWGTKKLSCHEAEDIFSNEINFRMLYELNDNFYRVFRYIPPRRAIEYMAVHYNYYVEGHAVIEKFNGGTDGGSLMIYFGIDEKYTIPENVFLPCLHNAFEHCIYLKILVFSAKKAEPLQMEMKNCRIESFEAVDTSAYCSYDGVLYTRNMKTLIKCPPAKKQLYVPEGVKYICRHSFYANENIESVVLPQSIAEIGWCAFSECKNMKYIGLPEYMEKIGANAFSGCSCLKDVVIPDGIECIEDSVFSGCESLEEIKLPDSVIQIKDYAFSGCISLKKAVFPGNISKIGKYAFYYCKSLRSINIPESVNFIKEMAFAECTKLRSVNIPETEMQISDTAFLGCILLDDVPFSRLIGRTDGLFIEKEKNEIIIKSVSESVCEVTIPPDVTAIGLEAFCGCINIEKILLPESVKRIYGAAFSGCMSLKEADMSFTPDIGVWTFSGCEKLDKVKLCPDTKQIGMEVFKDCKSLREIILPKNLEEIDEEAFSGCCSLREINIPSGVTVISGKAFENCTMLSSIQLPDGLKELWDNCFRNTAVSYIIIPPSVNFVREHVFADCPNLCSAVILNPELDPQKWGLEFFTYNKKVKRKAEMQLYGYAASPVEAFAARYNYEFIPISPEK